MNHHHNTLNARAASCSGCMSDGPAGLKLSQTKLVSQYPADLKGMHIKVLCSSCAPCVVLPASQSIVFVEHCQGLSKLFRRSLGQGDPHSHSFPYGSHFTCHTYIEAPYHDDCGMHLFPLSAMHATQFRTVSQLSHKEQPCTQ